RALAHMSHPNVVSIFDVGRLDAGLFLAMEFIDGATLGDWLRAQPRSTAEIVHAFEAAGRGLAAAHARGLVHRDFKPENVLVGKDGRVVVTDFGLARRHGAASHAAGTPAYMAPEQLRGEPPDARSDQFAFCVALNEALYARRPRVPARIARAVAKGLE